MQWRENQNYYQTKQKDLLFKLITLTKSVSLYQSFCYSQFNKGHNGLNVTGTMFTQIHMQTVNIMKDSSLTWCSSCRGNRHYTTFLVLVKHTRGTLANIQCPAFQTCHIFRSSLPARIRLVPIRKIQAGWKSLITWLAAEVIHLAAVLFIITWVKKQDCYINLYNSQQVIIYWKIGITKQISSRQKTWKHFYNMKRFKPRTGVKNTS